VSVSLLFLLTVMGCSRADPDISREKAEGVLKA
jgi:hypothetical protein